MPKKIQSSHVLMFPTSPRSPELNTEYLRVLIDNFEGCEWNRNLQEQLYYKFVEDGVMDGGESSYPDLSGREKITRALYPLGFVELKPNISLTDAGRHLLNGQHIETLYLHQLLKLQYPSPYHQFDENSSIYNCKPYLELLRLINTLGSVTKDEIILFGTQITSYHRFDVVVEKIQDFRRNRPATGYRRYLDFSHKIEVQELYANELAERRIHIRENTQQSVDKFISTKQQNMCDYGDAAIRYLRRTGYIALSREDYNYSVSIVSEHQADVDYILQNIDREAVPYENVAEYNEYLRNPHIPVLLCDDIDALITTLINDYQLEAAVLEGKSIDELRSIREDLLTARRNGRLTEQINQLREYNNYDDVLEKFTNITTRGYYPDAPVMLEWNTWRAMTMIDGGNIIGNFVLDDAGEPLSTARGNVEDIACEYQDFDINVEVTLLTGQRQYDAEGEPVARHVGRRKEHTGKETYGLFVAPSLNSASIDHFFMLNHVNVPNYGGKACIVPMTLDSFKMLLIKSHDNRRATPNDLRTFFENAKASAIRHIEDGSEAWYQDILISVENFLVE